MTGSVRVLLAGILFFQVSFAGSECASYYKATTINDEISKEQATYDLVSKDIVRKLKVDSETARKEVDSWIASLRQRQDIGENISVIEHVTLQLVLRHRFLQTPLTSEQNADLNSVLTTSWQKLTGRSNFPEDILKARLPKKVMESQPIQIRRYLDFVYRTDAKTLQIRDSRLVSFAKRVWPVALIAVGLSYSGLGVLAGAATGYFISLMAEYGLHRWFLHASPENHKSMQDFGLYLKSEDDVTRDHLLHHKELSAVKNAKNYIKQGEDVLSDPYVREHLVPEMVTLGMDENAQRNYVEDTNHATTLTKRVQIVGYMMFVPIGLLAGWIVGGHTPILGALSGAFFANSFTHFVAANHPSLHRTRESNLANATPFEKWYLDSAFFRSISRFHFLHHRRSNTNFHIMPGGFDWIMGTKKSPDIIDILNMMEADLFF